MPHRTPYQDQHRYGRDDEYRSERHGWRRPDRTHAEGRTWDETQSYGYRQGGYGSADYRNNPTGESRYDSRETYGGQGDRPYASGRYAGEQGRTYGQYSRGRYQSDAEHDSEPHGRRFTGSGYANAGYDYGQGGHGGLGSGGYDGASQTGGSAGFTGSRPAAYQYGSQGYAPGAQIWDGPGQDVASGNQSRHHEYEPDYLHWRDGQIRDLDRDYHAWRDERRQRFSKDFDEWRSQRRTQAASSTTSGNYGTPGASSDGDMGGTLESNSQVTKVAGADESARKKN